MTIFRTVLHWSISWNRWIQVEVFWDVTSFSFVLGYQRFRIHDSGWRRMQHDLWNDGIVPQYYTTSQPGILRIKCSPLWKPQISDESSPQFPTDFHWYYHLYTPRTSKWFILIRYFDLILYEFLTSPISAACNYYLFLNLTTKITLYEEYNYDPTHYAALTSYSHLDPNILLSFLLLNTVKLCSSLSVRYI
jgi:hypothetical protein